MSPDHNYMAPAWFSFVSFALGEESFRQEFERETKTAPWTPAKTALDRMIDEATGHARDYVEKFVVWVTETQWGEDMAPDIYFDKFKKEVRPCISSE